MYYSQELGLVWVYAVHNNISASVNGCNWKPTTKKWDIPISIQVQCHHREAVVLTMLQSKCTHESKNSRLVYN